MFEDVLRQTGSEAQGKIDNEVPGGLNGPETVEQHNQVFGVMIDFGWFGFVIAVVHKNLSRGGVSKTVLISKLFLEHTIGAISFSQDAV